MQKIAVSALLLLLVLTPFANANICEQVDSPKYLEATGAKLVRGTGNVLLSWVELFRQPVINENKWEGVGRGVVHTVARAASGAAEVVTAIIPNVRIPQADPPCPTDLVNDSGASSTGTATSSALDETPEGTK